MGKNPGATQGAGGAQNAGAPSAPQDPSATGSKAPGPDHAGGVQGGGTQ